MAIGIGIIGTGFIGRVHAQAAQLAGARVVGVVDSNPEKSLSASREFRAERHFEDVQQLISCDEVEVVHVCTPNYLHAEHSNCALDAGKHVICEKPLATNSRDAANLAARAAKIGVIAAVPFTYRYHTMVQEARARVQAGAIGAIHTVHGSYLQDWLLSSNSGNWRVSSKLGGPSRAFADIGSHWCDLAEWVSGHEIVDLCAVTETVIPKRRSSAKHTFETDDDPDFEMEEVETEDVACLIFRATGGVVGTLTVSQVAAGRKNRIWIEVDGFTGSLTFDEEQPDRLWIGRQLANEELVRDPSILSPEAKRINSLPPGHHEGFVGNFVAFLGDVYAAVQGEARPFPRFADGARSTRITEAVLLSSSTSRWASV